MSDVCHVCHMCGACPDGPLGVWTTLPYRFCRRCWGIHTGETPPADPIPVEDE